MISILTKQLLADVTEHFSNIKGGTAESVTELQQQLKVHLEARLREMNLVTREEFDAQAAVLQRTRQQLDELDQQVKMLEQQLTSARQ